MGEHEQLTGSFLLPHPFSTSSSLTEPGFLAGTRLPKMKECVFLSAACVALANEMHRMHYAGILGNFLKSLLCFPFLLLGMSTR